MTSKIPKIRPRAARINKGLNQEEASRKLLISRSTLQNYESGKTKPPIDVVERMSELYEIGSDFLFFD